jgi:hypothetical protein
MRKHLSARSGRRSRALRHTRTQCTGTPQSLQARPAQAEVRLVKRRVYDARLGAICAGRYALRSLRPAGSQRPAPG